MSLLWRRKRRTKTTTLQLANGDVVSLTQEIVPGTEPLKKTRKRVAWLPVWQIIFFVYFIFIVRILAIADMGVPAYQYRMEELKEGTRVERAIAQFMVLDPVSSALATDLRKTIKAWVAYTEREDD